MRRIFANEETIREKLGDQVREVIDDTEALLKESVGNASEKARDLQDRLASRIRSLRDSLGDRQENWTERATRRVQEADRLAHDHPYPVVAFALAFGVLLGALLTRR